MINRYALTHPAIEGHVLFEYEMGMLIEYRIDGTIAPAILDKLIDKFPLREPMLLQMDQKKGAKIEMLPYNLTFERFWSKYAHKPAGSSKKLAEAKWNKLSDADRHQALKYIAEYDREIRNSNTPKKYAETYLNQRIWVR